MKAISLLQPWATLVVIGAKKIETRSWNTKYRGEVLIHASKSREHINLICQPYFIDYLPHRIIQNNESKIETVEALPDELPFGAIVGKVNIVDTCDTLTLNAFGHYWGSTEITDQERAFGDYTNGRYGWLLSDPVKFKKTTPAKGSLSIWNFDEQICLTCGCTDDNACISKMFGPCWWVTENLCSHCAEGVQDT